MKKIRDQSNEKAEKAKEIYYEHKGQIKLVDIAKAIGVTPAMVTHWKKIYKWESFKKDPFALVEKNTALGLDVKMQAFCHNYLRTFNASQSALDAGYSKDTYKEIGCILLKNPKVKAYLKELKLKNTQDDYLTAQMIIDRHKKIAFADMRQFFDENWNPKPIDEVDGTLIKKVTIKRGKNYEFSIELEDRSKSLEFLSKLHNLVKKETVEEAELVTIVDDIPKNNGGDSNEN